MWHIISNFFFLKIMMVQLDSFQIFLDFIYFPATVSNLTCCFSPSMGFCLDEAVIELEAVADCWCCRFWVAQRVRRLSTGLLCLGGGSLAPAGCCGKSGLGGEGRHSAGAKQGSYCWIEHSAPWPVNSNQFLSFKAQLLHNHPDIFTMLFTTA